MRLILENGIYKLMESNEKMKLLTKKVLKKRASSDTLEGLKKVIKNSLYWAEVIFKEIEKGLWSVHNLKGLRKYYVVKEEKRGFFLYEIMDDEIIKKVHNL